MNDKQITIAFICLNKLQLLLFIKNKHVYYILVLSKHGYKYFICNNAPLSINIYFNVATACVCPCIKSRQLLKILAYNYLIKSMFIR